MSVILVKKILIGVVIYILPILVIWAGLWLKSKLQNQDDQLAGKDYTLQP